MFYKRIDTTGDNQIKRTKPIPERQILYVSFILWCLNFVFIHEIIYAYRQGDRIKTVQEEKILKIKFLKP